MNDDQIMELYIKLLKWYSNRFHSNKITGQYYDRAYGTGKIKDVRRLVAIIEDVDIEILHKEGHLTLNIELDVHISPR